MSLTALSLLLYVWAVIGLAVALMAAVVALSLAVKAKRRNEIGSRTALVLSIASVSLATAGLGIILPLFLL